MSNTNQTGPKRRVRREALRQLTVADLTLVAGGTTRTSTCSYSCAQ